MKQEILIERTAKYWWESGPFGSREYLFRFRMYMNHDYIDRGPVFEYIIGPEEGIEDGYCTWSMHYIPVEEFLEGCILLNTEWISPVGCQYKIKRRS